MLWNDWMKSFKNKQGNTQMAVGSFVIIVIVFFLNVVWNVTFAISERYAIYFTYVTICVHFSFCHPFFLFTCFLFLLYVIRSHLLYTTNECDMLKNTFCNATTIVFYGNAISCSFIYLHKTKRTAESNIFSQRLFLYDCVWDNSWQADVKLFVWKIWKTFSFSLHSSWINPSRDMRSWEVCLVEVCDFWGRYKCTNNVGPNFRHLLKFSSLRQGRHCLGR